MATQNNPLLTGLDLDNEDSQDPRLMLARSLTKSFSVGAMGQNEDPLKVAETQLSQVPLGRRILADFLVGFSNSFAGTQLKTTREQLVEREVLSQSLKARQAQQRSQMLNAQIQLINSLPRPDLKMQALQQLVKDGRITKEDAQREIAGIQAPRPQAPPATGEAAAIQQALANKQDPVAAAVQFRKDVAKAPEEKDKTIADILNDPLAPPAERQRAMALNQERIFGETQTRLRAAEPFKDKPEETGGFQAPANPFGSSITAAFNNLAPKIGPKNQREAVKQSLQDVARLDDSEPARKIARERLFNAADITLSATDQKTVTSARDVTRDLGRIQDLMSQYVAAGGDLNLLRGSAEEVAERLGTVTSGPLARIASEIKSTAFNYITQRSGAQFTDRERQWILGIFPNVSSDMGLNRARIDGLVAQAVAGYADRMRTTLGSQAFDQFFVARTPSGKRAVWVGDLLIAP